MSGCYWISVLVNYDMYWNVVYIRYFVVFLCSVVREGCSFFSFRVFKVDDYLIKSGSEMN